MIVSDWVKPSDRLVMMGSTFAGTYNTAAAKSRAQQRPMLSAFRL